MSKKNQWIAIGIVSACGLCSCLCVVLAFAYSAIIPGKKTQNNDSEKAVVNADKKIKEKTTIRVIGAGESSNIDGAKLEVLHGKIGRVSLFHPNGDFSGSLENGRWYLIVPLRLSNTTKTTIINYNAYAYIPHRSSPTVTDEHGNRYNCYGPPNHLHMQKSVFVSARIDPGQTIEDYFLCEIPQSASKEITIVFPCLNFGKTGTVTCKMPTSQFKKQSNLHPRHHRPH